MSEHRRVRGLRFYLEYEYDSLTKDMLEDLLTQYTTSDEILSKAIALLHEQHFGSITKKTPPPRYSETLSTTNDDASQKLDLLWEYVQQIKEDVTHRVPVEANNNSQAMQFQLSEEANKMILEKIDDLGMRFSKIMTEQDKSGIEKKVTAEMSNEEILQLIKRIDQLESKLTRAISQSRVAAAPASSSRSGMRDLGEPPKIGEIKKIDGPVPDVVDRPLLDDVLDSVIVSTEEE